MAFLLNLSNLVVGRSARGWRFMHERRCFSGRNSFVLGLLARTGRASRPLSSVFRHGRVAAGLWSRVGHGAIRATVVFNNLNNEQFVVYFRIRGYGAGKVDDVAAQAESSPPGRAMLQKLAKRKAVQDVEGTGTERPLGAGRPNASAGRHRLAGSERNLEAS
jgi:hypothetical protein